MNMSQTKKKFYQPILCTYCDEYYPIGPGIRKHLVHAHGAIYKDYVRYNLNLFPNYSICYICNVNITKGVTCSKICDKQHRKIIFKGEKNSFFNKKHTKKTLQLISEQLGNYYADHPSNFSGKCHSLESRKKMSISALNNTSPNRGMTGKTFTPQSREKMRNSFIRYAQSCKGVNVPNYNKNSISIIEQYGKENGYNFQHAENGGEFQYIGYFADGYDKEKNVWLEIDEPHHFNKNGAYKERDIKRQKEIQEALNCKFIRIKLE